MATALQDLTLADVAVDFGDNAARVDEFIRLGREFWLVGGMFGPVVTRYEDVTAILRDKRWHSASGKLAELFGVTDPEFIANQQVSILSAEGDVHTRLRRLVSPAFSPRNADALRPFMRDVVNGLVDSVAAAGKADFAVDICESYPIPIICELLGAPASDRDLFSRWANDILEVFSMDMATKIGTIMKAQNELGDYTNAMIEERRSKPADDLLTLLIAAEEAGDKLSNDELVMMVNAVIVAGTDTTRNQLGCAVALFAQHPQQWALLAERPELAPRAVEESMRYFGAVRETARFASVDIEYRDVLFPQGTFIGLFLEAANRDETMFPAPGVFDITAPAPKSPQLTFGSGIHYCLGASLARAELQEALPILARRMPNLQLDGPTVWKPETVGIFGPERLPVTFDPGH